MKRIRQKSIKLLGEKVQLAIPLYPDEPLGLELLPSEPMPSYSGITRFNHILIHFGRLLDKVKSQYFPYHDINLHVPNSSKELENLTVKITNLVERIDKTEKVTDKKIIALEYKRILNQIAGILNNSIKRRLKTPYTFVPLRGGAHVVSVFQVPLESMIAIDCKRIPLIDGTFAFGMHSPVFDPYDVDRVHKQKVRVVEVCIASGITSVGIMLDFFAKGCPPQELIFQVLFASKVGLSFIHAAARELGMEVKVYAAKIYDGLGDLTMPFDSIVNDQKKKVIGDASAILDLTGSIQK